MTKNKDIDYEREVCKSVLEAMGKRPKNMFKITAGNVFDNNWRVNIWSTKLVEGEYSSLTTNYIEHSFFLKKCFFICALILLLYPHLGQV